MGARFDEYLALQAKFQESGDLQVSEQLAELWFDLTDAERTQLRAAFIERMVTRKAEWLRGVTKSKKYGKNKPNAKDPDGH